jgi:hypothetical protein
MEREQILKVMVPVGAFAVLLLIIGVVIAFAGGGLPSPASGGKSEYAPLPNASSGKELGTVVDDGAGMVADLPPLGAAEWKDAGNPNTPGLRVWDVKEGTEDITVTAGDTVKARYTGWLLNGSRFDGGPDRAAIPFSLNEVIKGWTHGLPGMKVGGIRRLYIPSAHAYGSQNSGKIPPNSDLVFEVKLIRVSR